VRAHIKIDAMTMLGEFLRRAEKATGAKGTGSNQHKKVVRYKTEPHHLPSPSPASPRRNRPCRKSMALKIGEKSLLTSPPDMCYRHEQRHQRVIDRKEFYV
jgi:hypothetical protein